VKTKKNLFVSLSIFIVIIFVLTLFGEQGKPFQKIWNKLNGHDSRITDLEATVFSLQTQLEDANSIITDLQTRMDEVENELSNLPAIGPPDYDSGWFNFGEITLPNATVTHRYDHFLGGNPDNYVVNLQVKNSEGNIHNKYYGADGEYVGVYMFGLDDESVFVTRTVDDLTVWLSSDFVRIRIWVYED